MERNYNILALLFASWFLCNCEYKEFPDDLRDYYIPLKEAAGEYVYIPYQNTEYGIDDYRYLNLKQGDTLKLKIKSDSTFVFNYFYHDRAIKTENFAGKFTTCPTHKNILIFKNYPDGLQYMGFTNGFKKGEKYISTFV